MGSRKNFQISSIRVIIQNTEKFDIFFHESNIEQDSITETRHKSPTQGSIPPLGQTKNSLLLLFFLARKSSENRRTNWEKRRGLGDMKGPIYARENFIRCNKKIDFCRGPFFWRSHYRIDRNPSPSSLFIYEIQKNVSLGGKTRIWIFPFFHEFNWIVDESREYGHFGYCWYSGVRSSTGNKKKFTKVFSFFFWIISLVSWERAGKVSIIFQNGKKPDLQISENRWKPFLPTVNKQCQSGFYCAINF